MTENKAKDLFEATEATKYDAVPYESFPYPNTSPERMFTIGKLFGMETVDFKNCKVLELGCASGGNLIPYAAMFPNSSFTGIDLSEVQVAAGQKDIESLGLKNITLKTMSILDITAKFGKFDYIVVHGVLSWVPKKVQDKIFEIFSKNLTKNGVAYVSYNTLPGWNAIRSIREMMLYHTQGFESPAEKVAQARLLLNFIKDANEGVKTPYSLSIESEIETLAQCSDNYLLHDHLEDNNEPFYFHDIAARASDKGLQYLGDTAIASMFPGNFAESTAEILKSAANDVVRVEQYMDFLRNRRFRTSLFCNKEVVLNRNLSPVCLEDFFLLSQVSTNVNLDAIDLTSHNEVAVSFNNGLTLTTSNPSIIIALKVLLSQKGKPIATKDLLNQVFDILGGSVNKEVTKQVILEQLLRLVLADAVGIFSSGGNFTTEISGKPKASALARYQAQNNVWITNQRAEKAGIDLFNRVLIQYLDGNNDFDSILEKMITHVENDDLVINVNGEKVADKKLMREAVTAMTKQNIENLAPQAVLVA